MSFLIEFVKSMYVNEPCRICGIILSEQDIDNNAVFAGCSKNCESRSAHKNCWDKNLPKSKWFYPIDDIV